MKLNIYFLLEERLLVKTGREYIICCLWLFIILNRILHTVVTAGSRMRTIILAMISSINNEHFNDGPLVPLFIITY
jgi:hypothetical protein